MPKICPKCYTRFEHEVAFCPHDGQGLIECDAEGEASHADKATRVSRDAEATRTAEALPGSAAGPRAGPEDPLVGATFAGRFKVERLLGRGGMGSVYVAFQDSVERRVALKVLSSECQGEPDLVKRFFFEARVMSQLANPHLIWRGDSGEEVIVPLGKEEMTIGTGPEANIQLPGGLLTGKIHARVKSAGKGHSVAPMAWWCKVLVNGRKVKDSQKLTDGDRIEIAGTVLSYRAALIQ